SAVDGPVDQRGLPRTVNGLVDIGAVEMQPGELAPGGDGGPATSMALQANGRALHIGNPQAVEGEGDRHTSPRPAASSVVAVGAVPIQPGELPPGDYGGPTIRLASQANSRARSAGGRNTLMGAVDRYGWPRTADGPVDIGAVQM